MSSPASFPFLTASVVRPVPAWIARDAALTGDDAAFRAGAALACLHPVVTGQAGRTGQIAGKPAGGGYGTGVPLALLRDRMAMAAAEACVVRSGGRARSADLRDRICFLAPDAAMDPETAQVDLWRRAVSTSLRGDALLRLLPVGMADAAGSSCGTGPVGWHAGEDEDGEDGNDGDGSDTGDANTGTGDETGGPVARAVRVLERFREAPPDHRSFILMLADAALARALGWPSLLPLLSTRLARRDPGLEGAALRRACDAALTREAVRAVRLAADLERRAARLRAVTPKLRAKASDAAVALLLSRDAVAPMTDLAPVVRGTRTRMSPRAAGRLCDRLVELGAVRELTGRATFRLYGL